MSLNDIQIPASVAVDLYRSVLVESGSEKNKSTKPENTISSEWKYLGNNKKNILVIVNYADTPHVPDPQLAFLTNILAACKLDLGDIALVNVANYPNDNYKRYLDFFKSRVVLLFGHDPVSFGLPVDFPHFQVQPLGAGTFLYSPSLDEFEKDGLLKSKLWVCLRRIFDL